MYQTTLIERTFGTGARGSESCRTEPRQLRRSAHQAPLPGPAYDRARDLPRLVALWPEEIADTSASGRSRMIQRLRRALREERRRGVAGHWSYDLARHAALLRAYRYELAAHGRAFRCVQLIAEDGCR